jgi:hypothetical protein
MRHVAVILPYYKAKQQNRTNRNKNNMKKKTLNKQTLDPIIEIFLHCTL